jgi:glycosyltransferase involved in cell wall biosynthesis
MRIAIVKPDWGIRGGFEVVADRVEEDLRGAGHVVERVDVPVAATPRAPFGAPVADEVWTRAPEWFSHLAMLEAFRTLDVRSADLVISTQPPSYAVDHPRQLALFYHHARAFYDLEEVWIAAGRAPRALHAASAALLRSAEAPDLAKVTHFLAGSRRVRERLHTYQGADVPVSLYESAAPDVEAHEGELAHVLTVSRHEFTKRTELTVQALSLGTTPGVLVGDGGRLPFVRDLAGRIADGDLDAATLTDQELWLNLGTVPGLPSMGASPQVRILGRVSDDEIAELYRDALCVVAPAYDEDDGLTVLEAMAYGKPVIVCRDGGGLTALVEDGVNGFVVEPDGASIAQAVARFAADPTLARTMGRAARERVASRTPEHARGQLLEAVEIAVAGGPR